MEKECSKDDAIFWLEAEATEPLRKGERGAYGYGSMCALQLQW